MKTLWFRRKRYGYGWTPCTWQGWAVVAGYAILVALAGLAIDERSGGRDIAFTFALPVFILTLALIRIASKTGEKPRWQWGEGREK